MPCRSSESSSRLEGEDEVSLEAVSKFRALHMLALHQQANHYLSY